MNQQPSPKSCPLIGRILSGLPGIVFLHLAIHASGLSQELSLDHYDVDDGLPSNWITAIAQDETGRMWVGGDGGICSYDGVSFAAYGSPEGVTSMVWAIVPSRVSPGTIYFGTHSSGLGRFRNGIAVKVPLGDDPRSQTVSSLLEDSNGRLWCGTNGGVYVVEGDSASLVSVGGDGGAVRFLVELIDGSILIGIGRNLFLGRASGSVEPLHITGNSFEFTCATQGKDGTLWFGTDDGTIVRVTDGSVTATLRTSADYIRAVEIDADGTLWGAAGFGLLRASTSDFPGGRAVLFGATNGLREPDIFSVFIDREDNVWFGGRNHGLSKLPYQNIVWFRFDGLHPDFLNQTVSPGENGHLFVATNDAIWEVWKSKSGSWQRHRHQVVPPSPPMDSLRGVASVDIDPDGRLWMGFPHGGLRGYQIVNREDKPSLLQPLRTFAPGVDLPMGGSGGVFVNDGQLWYTQRGGVYARLDLSTMKVEQVFDTSLRNGTVRGMSIGPDGNFWVATFFGGVHILSRSGDSYRVERTLTESEGLVSNRIRSIALRRNGDLWLGTRFDGIVVVRGETFSRIRAGEGLLNNAVWSLVEDEEGRIWVGTSSGLQYTRPDRDELFTHPRFRGGPVEGVGFIPGRKTLWSLIGASLMIYEYDHAEDAAVPPLISITGLYVNGNTHEPANEIVLPYDEGPCVIRFSGISLKDERNVTYRYRLLGLDTAWTELTDHRSVTFGSLKSGSYRFEVRAISALGIESEDDANLSFVVLPPWYLSPWTIGLYVVGGALLVFLYVRIRTRALERRSHDLEELVAERTAEVVDQRNQLHEQANKLLELDRIKSHFFANISHEFRTPLTVVLSHLERLQRGMEEKKEDSYGAMSRNARRLLQLINQLLDLSKLEAGAMTLRAAKTDLNELTRRVTALFESYARHKAISLLFNAGSPSESRGSPAIMAYVDRDKIEKVLTNLISNALKFTPHGGLVNVSLSSGITDVTTRREVVEILVNDSGHGIPGSDLPRVFDRFYQVQSEASTDQGGTGIGLALVKELVELHHGTVSVESTVGRGTAFRIHLPLGTAHLDEGEIVDSEETLQTTPVAEIPAEAELLAPPTPADVHTSDETTILIVEDNTDLRNLLRNYLSGEYLVLEAGNGHAGVQSAREHMPDLVISDVMMPGTDGYALCEALKTDGRTDHIPVILLTAKAAAEHRIKGLETGADDYLTKPFDSEELLVRVRNLIRSRRQLREKFSSEMLVRPSGVTAPSSQRIFLERVTRAIEGRIGDEAFGVEDLGKAVGLSRAQLHRKLRALTNKAPNELIRSFRLQRAAELIRQESGTFAEIAYRVGFGSQAYFTRCFQDEFGQTPSEYRKGQKSGDPQSSQKMEPGPTGRKPEGRR